MYEVAALALTFLMFGAVYRFGRRRGIVLPAQTQLIVALGTFALVAILTTIVALAINVAKQNSQVTACKSNEQTIAGALAAWEQAYGPYAATTSADVTAHSGSTAGTFSAPGFAATDLLQSTPIDPANPTGSYKLTVVPQSASANESFTIVCPGPHTQSALGTMAGASSATAGQIVDTNGNFSAQ